MEYQSVEYADRNEFIEYMEGGFNLYANRNRPYDPNGRNVEERHMENEDGEMVLAYVVQKVDFAGYDGEYYYSYYLSDTGSPDDRFHYVDYHLGGEVWAFNVNESLLIDYVYHKDGTVTAVTAAEEFSGYNLLIGLCAAGCAIAALSTVILVAFRIKLIKVRDNPKSNN